MAELLVRAKRHWMDDLKQEDIDKMTPEKKQSYEARSQIGDIIVVRPDGWEWGTEECLPNFVVIKTPDKYDDAKKYEETLNAKKDVVRTREIPKATYDASANKAELFAMGIGTCKVAPAIKETKTDTYVVEATVEEPYLKRIRKHCVDATIIESAVKDKMSVVEIKDMQELPITVKS